MSQRISSPSSLPPTIVQGLRLHGHAELTLRWLDPDREFVVEHHADGSVTLRPLSPLRYIARPDHDGHLTLRHALRTSWGFARIVLPSDGSVVIAPAEVPASAVGIQWALTRPEFRTVRFPDGSSSMRRRQVVNLGPRNTSEGIREAAP